MLNLSPVESSRRECTPFRPPAGPRARDIEGLNSIVFNELQHYFGGDHWIRRLPRANENVRSIQQRAQIPRQSRSAIENCGSVTIHHIQSRPLPVAALWQDSHRVTI